MGLMLQQATNKFVFNAVFFPNGVWGPSANITNIQMTLKRGGCVIATGTGDQRHRPGHLDECLVPVISDCPANQVNTVVMTMLDANGKIGTSSVTFDTYNPTKLYRGRAEEFDFNKTANTLIMRITPPPMVMPSSYYQTGQRRRGGHGPKSPSRGGVNATDYRAGRD